MFLLRVVLGLQLLLLCPVMAVCGSVPPVSERSAAVLEFTMLDHKDGEDWAAGLADFTAAALQEHGVETFERSQVNYLLAEHKLQDQGFAQPMQAVRQKLPWVHFLVNGTISKEKSAVFTLTVSLADMTTGQETARLSKSGNYPDQLAEAASALAAQLAEKIGSAKSGEVRREEKQGFTNSPEIALGYYKGLDYFLRGQPEYAEHYFRTACTLDKGFSIAARWRMRAYEKLKLQDFSDRVAEELRHARGGILAEEQLKDKDRLTVSVIPPLDPQGRDAALEKALRAVIAEQPSLQLFSQETISAVSDEIDRGLSGSFDQHMLKDQEWLSTDALFSISWAADGGAEKKRIAVQLIDSLSGKIVGTESRPAAETARLEDTVREMVLQLWKNNVSADGQGQQLSRSLAPMTPERIDSNWNEWTQAEREAYGLRLMSDKQDDLDALEFYLNIMLTGNLPNKGYEWPFIELVLNRMEPLVQKDGTDASFWTYFIQWKRIFRRWFDPWATNETGMVMPRKDGKLLERHFAQLIATSGDSLPALLAQYAIALDKLYSGDSQTAFAMLDKVADKIAGNQQLASMEQPLSGLPCEEALQHEISSAIYYFAAKTALEIGGKDKAQQYADKAKRAAERFNATCGGQARLFPNIYGVQRIRGGRWVLTHELLPPNLNVREGFCDEINSLSARIAGGGQKEMSIDQLNDRFSGSQMTEEAIVADGLLLLRRITDAVKNNDAIDRYDTMSRNVSRRVLSAAKPDREKEVVDTLKELTIAYKKHYDQMMHDCPDIIGTCANHPIFSTRFDELMFDLFRLSGQDRMIEEQTRQMLNSKQSRRRMMGCRNQALLLYETKSPRASADVLLKEIQRFEKDFPQERGEDYVELLFWCGQGYLDADDEFHALDVFKRGTEQTRALQKDAPCERKELAASLMQQQADLLIRQHDMLAAADLLKQIVSFAEGCENFSSRYITERKKKSGRNVSAPFFAVKNGLLEIVLKKLESLRATDKLE